MLIVKKVESGENYAKNMNVVIMKLTGENGKTANVLTAWLDDKKTGEMRLINAYVDKKKGGNHD